VIDLYITHAQFLNNTNKPTSFSVRKARMVARLDFFPSIVVYQLQQMTNALDIHNKAYPIRLVTIHHKKKDGGGTFYHNTLRTKLRPLSIWKDMV